MFRLRTNHILAAFVLFSANSVIAQDYVPFPTDSAFWKTSFTASFGSYLIDNTYEISGDTSIGSQVYHKIYETEIKEVPPVNEITFYPRTYIGGIREQDKIVYFLPDSYTTEHTIYDFNLGVGDTVNLGIYPCQDQPFVITNINPVTLNDQSVRKKYVLQSCGNATGWYIEGLGNAYGPLPCYCSNWGPGSYNPNLACFIDHGTFLYSNGSADCTVITTIEEMPNEVSPINVYPNPFHEQCVITFDKLIQEGHLKIFNQLGQLVVDRIVFNTQQETIYATEVMHSGIYLLTFSSENEMVSRKIMLDRSKQ